MRRSNISVVSRFVENVAASRTRQQAMDALFEAATNFGFERVVYGHSRIVSHDKPLNSPAILLERGLPAKWRNTYKQIGCFDPYLRVPCSLMRPARWADINRNVSSYPRSVQKFIDWTVNDLGMKDGSTIPVRTSVSDYSIVSFVDGFRKNSADKVIHDGTLSLLANYFVNHMRSHDLGGNDKVRSLSKREEECLYWLSQGKTVEDIAIILGISPETVRSYFKRIAEKLETSNRTHALAKAVSLGLFEIPPVKMGASVKQ